MGTPLHHATAAKQVDTVRALLAAGANAGALDSNGKSCFQLATEESLRTAFIGELLQAIAQKKPKRVVEMLKAGVNPNSSDGAASRNTPLHWTAR